MERPDPEELYDQEFVSRARKALEEMGITDEPVIERPKKGVADLCLVCFPLARSASRPPRELARELKERIGDSERYRLEVQGGYLNCIFRPAPYTRDVASYLWSEMGSIGAGKKKDDRVVVEHTSANPNGPFHVGRGRNPIIGDTLVRVLDLAGYDVSSQYWVNDMGKQAMVLVWGVHNIDPASLPPVEREKEDHDLVRYYQRANELMESDPGVAAEIDRLLADYERSVAEGDWERVISAPGRPVIRAGDVRSTCEKVLSGMRRSLSRLNVRPQEMVYESKVVEDGSLKEVISGLGKSPLSREEEGALYLDLSDLIKGGDDIYRRRFVYTRSDGSALYTTRDLAYHKWKLDNCDHAINVLGEDHRYQSLLLDLALGELGVEKRPEAVFYAFVSLPEGKMSTRRGRVVYLDDLLDEAEERALEEVTSRREDLGGEDLERIAEIVGIGALRFNMIKVQPEKKIVFRWEEALNFEGSTAPFIQYSHARASSILRKAEEGKGTDGEPVWSTVVEDSERELLKRLYRFEETVEKAAGERKVHLIAVYLVETASAFNDFYRDCPVLSEEDTERRRARLALTELTREVLSTGLGLLGIKAPDIM